MMALLEKIDKLPVNQRLAIMGLLLGLIGAGFWQLVWSPKQKDIARLTTELNGLQSDLQGLRVVHAKLPEFQAKIEQLSRQLSEIRKQLPQEREIPDLLRNISDAARDSGLTTELFRPANEAQKPLYIELPVNLTFRGPFHNVAAFVDKVAHFPRIINVTTMQLGSPLEEGGFTFITASLQATTYRYVEKN